MPLDRLATELEETARQTAEMVEGITEALHALSDESMTPEAAKAEAVLRIIVALQGQDRIEQRCRNIAHAVRQFAKVPHDSSEEVFDEIWASLSLDELRLASMSGIAATEIHGEAELI
jgi:DNA-directed RNA polymerase subunit F